MKTLRDFNIEQTRFLVRCDFNVPLTEIGDIQDDFRIRQVLPTIKFLMENGAKIILMSHLGDPSGQIVQELKMDKIAERLSEILGKPVVKENDCIGPNIESQSKFLTPGQVMLLENLRFYKEEEENDIDFAKKLSFLGDVYVNDAFSVCHRNHASVASVPKFLDHCAGLLLEKEIENLDKIFKDPARPFIGIIGGAKVETKVNFINNISKVADTVLISGLIAKEAKEKNIQFLHPEKIISPVGDWASLDINKESIELFTEKIKHAETILWNGAFGMFEEKQYEKGTLAIAKAIIKSGAFSVVGGGETVEFLKKQGMIEKFNHVSTGGGAMLSYLAGDKMPGLDALNENK